MKNLISIITKLFAAVSIICIGSCNSDFLEPTPATDKDLQSNVNTVDDLTGLMYGAYERMSQHGFYGRDVIAHASARSDDGFSNGNSGRFIQSAQFNLTENSLDVSLMWSAGYQVMANVNIIINSNTLDASTPEVNQVKGEAYAIRALAHMELLKYFGQQYAGGTLGIPYITEYLGDTEPSRKTITEVWNLIGNDLDMASTLMTESLNEGPVRITTFGVAALKTRYYLYTQEWSKLIDEAEYVINSSNFALADAATYAPSFVGSGGNTSIFELAFNGQDNLNADGLNAIYNSDFYGDLVTTQDLYDIYEGTDVRKDLFDFDVFGLGVYRCIGKYPSPTFDDNIRVVRYAEVILNYAEALLASSQPANALIELNKTIDAANGTSYVTATLDNILLERRKELAFEGFRYFDLMRNGLPILKVDPAQTFSGSEVVLGEPRNAFPIPIAELNANPNMVQNDLN